MLVTSKLSVSVCAESQFCVSPWLPVAAPGWTPAWCTSCLTWPGSFAPLPPSARAGGEPRWQPGLAQALSEAYLNDGLRAPVNLVGVVVKTEGSVLHIDGRQLKIGSLLALGKMAAFFAMLTCLIVRNSAVAEIYSLNIINKTALAAGLQTSCWGTRKNKTTKF